VERGDLIKTIVSVVALAGGAGLVAWHFLGSDELDKAEYRYLVDITTGDAYRVRMSEINALIVPARHPETREPVLFPIEEQAEGRWRIIDRYLSGFDASNYDADLHPVARGSAIGPFERDEIARYVPPPIN